MFCVVDVLAGVFFTWLILRPFVVLRWRGRQKVGSCWWELLLNFGVDDIILHRLVIHSLIHMYRIRDCDRSGISTAPWRQRQKRHCKKKQEVALQGFAFPLDVFSPSPFILAPCLLL
ncbi:hypothetical protein RchiOBHm_Chr5g0035891 [Rosa chinensis]|uniref:Uncharacterized protein n=1 Tax=Rosa chinensis TaxID=74649 RepID=A0A2P6QBD2_ROSCH|nr:hypothetical protein RchiOBHm_Chr5g0035891 [Rosa chinensis]